MCDDGAALDWELRREVVGLSSSISSNASSNSSKDSRWPGRLFAPLATLAAAVSPSRAGLAAPAAGQPMAGAPSAVAPEAQAIGRGRLRRSLRASSAEGLVAEVVNACAGGAVLTGWAIYLHASALLTGIVVALPQMAQLLQIPAAWSTASLGHRRACVLLVGVSRQVLLPMALLPFLGLGQQRAQAVLVGVSALSAVVGVLGNNAWVSWMSELVPRRIRGRYFGRRTAMCTVGGALASAGAGLLLDWARPHGLTGTALAALGLIACASGVVSTVLMLRQHDPCPHHEPIPLSLVEAMRPLRDRSVRGLIAYLLFWNVAVGVAGSFFSLHMLLNLRMGFTLVALHGATLAAARVLAAPLWGRLIDRRGARPVLIVCAFGISAIPLIWLFPTPERLWPLAFDAVAAGVLWGGHNLAAFALPLAVAPRRGRPLYFAAFSATTGLAFSLATALGGALAGRLPEHAPIFGHDIYNLQLLFVGSSLLRLAAAFLGLRIREPAAAGLGALWSDVWKRRNGRPANDVARKGDGPVRAAG
jgi:MFS family permease